MVSKAKYVGVETMKQGRNKAFFKSAIIIADIAFFAGNINTFRISNFII